MKTIFRRTRVTAHSSDGLTELEVSGQRTIKGKQMHADGSVHEAPTRNLRFRASVQHVGTGQSSAISRVSCHATGTNDHGTASASTRDGVHNKVTIDPTD